MSNKSTPQKVIIRYYQVGFGDCFLLRFEYNNNAATVAKHVLIDFGTQKLPITAPGMDAVANDIAQFCGGKLDALVVTHRHLDHLSGLSGKRGDIIKSLKPRLVLQPWTEDPQLEIDARKPMAAAGRPKTSGLAGNTSSLRSFVAMRDGIHALSRYILQTLPPMQNRSNLEKELSFIGERNLKNIEVVKNIQEMAAAGKAVYACYDGTSGLEEILPGVKVHVLGPPTIEQSNEILKIRKVDENEYWHLQTLAVQAPVIGTAAAGEAGKAKIVDLFDSQFRASKKAIPDTARWFLPRLEKMHGDQILGLVRILDDFLNNTSLILLFEVGGKKLLFPGDAQIENWSYALKYAVGDKAEKYRTLLKDVDVYKVGHHGSLNATPRKMLWENFSKRGERSDPNTLQTILSTMAGKHGYVENKTEVPRTRLVNVLKKDSRFKSTQELKSKSIFFDNITISI